MHFMYVAAEL